jgi:arylformamidase
MYIDITFPISEKLPKWPGSIGFKKTIHMEITTHGNNRSSFVIDSHFGTHLDAPIHFIENGKTIDQLDLNKLIGEVFVLEIRGKRSISGSDLSVSKIPKGCNKLILKTDNQIYWDQNIQIFQQDFCSINESGAKWLVENGFHFIGIDYLSIQRFNDGPETHQILLNSEIIIVESLNLKNVTQGLYEIICLPLNLQGLEGSPVRALIKPKDDEKV